MKMSSSQKLNLRQHAPKIAKAVGVVDLSAYEPHTRSWDDLCKDHRALRAEARTLSKAITVDNEERAQEIEDAFDAIAATMDAVEYEQDQRTASGNKAARSNGGPHHRPHIDDVGSDDDDRWWERDGGDEAETRSSILTSDRRMSSWASARSGGEERELPKLGNYLRSMITGPRNEVERRALSEGSDSAGGFTVPTELSAYLIDRLRRSSIVNQAGAVTVPLDSKDNIIAKLLTDPTPAWRAENGPVAVSDMTFGAVSFKPKSLAVLVKVSRELLEDSLNINTALPNVLAASLATELDRVAIFGSGEGNEPRGVVNFEALTETDLTGLTNADGAIELADYKPFLRARTALRGVNSDVTAFMMSVREDGALSELTDANGQPLQPPKAIATTPMLSSTAIPGVGAGEGMIVAGEWKRLMIGIRSEIRVEIIRESFAENLQYGFLCHLRADVAADHEQAFTVVRKVVPAAAG
ncbi:MULTISPECIES: phage major capsid protein [unclassified Neorhizobium]|uniref:phage major capsid protein n=1 Tax=unclassified Neorhizobium TaxID=2629175 RepID=UPI001FF2BEA2|nr:MULTISPECIES: phage major capsid protein [unclassified Neorhizobium]MCJ9672912.1 phage major capsid protein [Neorhizobium sp. SHOUNA12B]MCJ9748547.1 phage major capsid protein [Neorhizobium sp. SHOUNA12A]